MTNYKIDRGVEIAINAIEPNPWNPNKTSARVQEAIVESLENYGQIIELLVRPHPEVKGKYQIIDGEHRFSELSKSSSTVYANVLHNLPDAEAKKLTIILNETRGAADKIELATLLADISSELGDKTRIGLPYSENELDELIKLSEFDWDNFADNSGDEEGDDEEQESGNEEKLASLLVKLTPKAMELAQNAYDLVSDSNALNKDKAIAWGEVFESVLIDYLAAPD